jgi:hypothetical protein
MTPMSLLVEFGTVANSSYSGIIPALARGIEQVVVSQELLLS